MFCCDSIWLARKRKKDFGFRFSSKPCSCCYGTGIIKEIEKVNNLSPEKQNEDENPIKKKFINENELSLECCKLRV